MMSELDTNIGEGLRLARERAGVSLRDIADATKQSVQNLSALEKNRIKQLPGGIYRRAIVRSYAEQVGLDPEQTLRRFLAQYPDDVPTWNDLVPTAAPKIGVAALHRLVSAVGALVPVIAGVVYFSLGARTPQASEPLLDVIGGAEMRQASMLPASFTPRRTGDAVAMMVSVSTPTSLQLIADGREVVAGRVEPGKVIRLTLGSDVVLVGDNAGAVHFSINGRAGRALGDDGEPLTARISRSDYQDWLH
jgi:transcriptional regulator with XRE-family HTH domain